MRRRTVLASLIGSVAAPALARAFASRPITFVVPFAPGGGTDVIARLVGQKAAETLGQPVVVENRAGAAGAIANRSVMTAAADGHTLLIGTAGTQAAAPAVNPAIGFDPLADLAPVARLGATPNLLVVHPELPARSVAELVALARANPATLAYASSGTGTVSHLSGALFASQAGIRMNHVPYRGAGPANNDLVAGHVRIMFDTPVSLLPLVQANRVRALAVTSTERLAALPDVPTLRESGFPDYLAELWIGAFAPRNTPAAAIASLERSLLGAIATPEIDARMRQLGFEPRPGDATALRTTLAADLARWGRLAREAGIRLE